VLLATNANPTGAKGEHGQFASLADAVNALLNA
jgi:hypothetical protein